MDHETIWSPNQPIFSKQQFNGVCSESQGAYIFDEILLDSTSIRGANFKNSGKGKGFGFEEFHSTKTL